MNAKLLPPELNALSLNLFNESHNIFTSEAWPLSEYQKILTNSEENLLFLYILNSDNTLISLYSNIDSNNRYLKDYTIFQEKFRYITAIVLQSDHHNFEHNRIQAQAIYTNFLCEAELLNIFVIEECRGRSLASKLMMKIENFLSQNGTKNVFLECREKNIRARRLYENSLYKLISRRMNYYTDETDNACVYHRILDDFN